MRFFVTLIVVLCVANTAKAGDEIDLIGRWDLDKFDAYFIRFNTDHTVRIGGPRGFQEGTYRVSDDGVVELRTLEGGKVKRVERKYRLRGDTLELKIGAIWKTYKRAKSE